MRWFMNIRTQGKLLLVFGSLMAMVAALAVFTVNTINRIEARYSMLLEGPQQRNLYISDAAREMKAMRLCLFSMDYMAEDEETVNTYYTRYLETAALFLQYTDDYYNNLANDEFLPEEERIFYMAVIRAIQDRFSQDFYPFANEVYRASLAGELLYMKALIMESIPIGDGITEELGALRAQVQNTAMDMGDETRLFIHQSNTWVVGISVCILLMGFVVSVLMPQVIKKPIVAIETAMAEIAKGNLSYPIRSGYRDEIGVLSNRIGDMIDHVSMYNKTVKILDNLDDVIFVTDLQYRLLYINQKGAKLFGIDVDAARNRPCHAVLHNTDQPCAGCPLSALLPDKEGYPSRDWEQTITVNGVETSYACRSSIIRWVDGLQAHICTYKDDTIRKEKEEQRLQYEEELRNAALAASEASRMKSVFLANMSHEIRTPMNGIIGFSELALSDSLSSKTRDYLEKIKASSESLMQIINDILDISKIEAGKIELEHVPFDLHEIFRLCRTITLPKAMEKGITLFCYAEPSIDKMLVGDPTRLRQALLNLLSNAVKFTNTGMVKLLSAIHENTKDSVTIRFEVKDNGIGMAAEQIQRIFQPFVQADDSTTRKYGGTGLGLSITKNIIELMGGQLSVESTPGLGSKFGFELLFKTIDVPAKKQAVEVPAVKLEKPNFIGEVLVCEDNELNQHVINDNLTRVGLHTVIAVNGAEGVEHVKNRIENGGKPFDLIFMDIHMPVMDGLEAAKMLTEINNPTPVIALTANIMPNDVETYRSLGMLDCVPKPFRTHELWSCLLKYLQPISVTSAEESEPRDTNDKQRLMLLSSFVKDNQNTFHKIQKAIQDGDIKMAHRLAHTLKSVAGLIGMTMLQEAARIVEQSLSKGRAEFTDDQMRVLEYELHWALTELTPLVQKAKEEKPAAEPFGRAQARALFEKLETLLCANSFECVNLVSELEQIPGAEALIEQVEKFDFKNARATLAALQREWGDNNE